MLSQSDVFASNIQIRRCFKFRCYLPIFQLLSVVYWVSAIAYPASPHPQAHTHKPTPTRTHPQAHACKPMPASTCLQAHTRKCTPVSVHQQASVHLCEYVCICV